MCKIWPLTVIFSTSKLKKFSKKVLHNSWKTVFTTNRHSTNAPFVGVNFFFLTFTNCVKDFIFIFHKYFWKKVKLDRNTQYCLFFFNFIYFIDLWRDEKENRKITKRKICITKSTTQRGKEKVRKKGNKEKRMNRESKRKNLRKNEKNRNFYSWLFSFLASS